jgi:hypothetical protein
MDKEKLFIIDHHDVYMPFLDRINAIQGRKAYATRTIFFLTQAGTLKPIAIELCLPPSQSGEPEPSKVLTPPCDATSNWIWMVGKAHVSSNDAGVHQLVNHWYDVFFSILCAQLQNQLSRLNMHLIDTVILIKQAVCIYYAPLSKNNTN